MDATDGGSLARRLWAAAEAVHAVTYFHPRCLAALADAGTRGFWMGYFVGRLAPMGAVRPAVAEAVAFGFSPERPARALPDGWTYLAPADALRVRSEAAAEALADLGLPEPPPDVLDALERMRASAPHGGRPLGGANRALPLPDDPRRRLWDLVTWLREQRGDEHVALWVGEGLDGCEANVLTTAVHAQDPEVLRSPRAWSTADWDAATSRLVERGLLDGVAATETGRGLHAAIERRTDALTDALVGRALGDQDHAALVGELTDLAGPILAADLYPSPNPMGLPVPA